MEKKHINKKNANSADDEWSHLGEGVAEKIDSGDVMDIQDRSITFNDKNFVTTKEEDYKIESDDFKEKFSNTAQYLKYVNAHLAEKNNHLNKIIADKEKFYDDIAILNPEKMTKDQLDKTNYNALKVEDVKKVLGYIQEERDVIKDKIEHFTTQINQAKNELDTKNKEVDKIKSELALTEYSENLNQSNDNEENISEDSIKNEIKKLASKEESEKVFGAINSLIVLLNSKNDSTLNELKSVKSEFNKMKQDYEKVMKTLEKMNAKK